jgi:hypothetical protein
VSKTWVEIQAAERAKMPVQKIRELYSKLVAFKTIMNAIADIEADNVNVSAEKWKGGEAQSAKRHTLLANIYKALVD